MAASTQNRFHPKSAITLHPVLSSIHPTSICLSVFCWLQTPVISSAPKSQVT